MSLAVDNREVARTDLPGLWPVTALNAGLRCGRNDGPLISARYRCWFAFIGTLHAATATRL